MDTVRHIRTCFSPRRRAAVIGIFSCIFWLLNTCAGQTKAAASEDTQENVRILEVGHALEGRLAGGQKPAYGLVLSENQFVRFTIKPENPASNIQVTVLGPDDKKIEDLSGPVCPFSVYYMSAVSGLYQIRLELLHGNGSPPGSDNSLPPETYKIQIDELRNAADQDRTRIAASQTLIHAYWRSFRSSPPSEDQSAEKYDEATSLFRAAGDRRGEAQVLQVLSLRSFVAKEYEEAADYLRQARPIWHALAEYGMEAAALTSMADYLARLGKLQEALDSLNGALPLRRALGDVSGEAMVLIRRGDVYDAMGEFQQALNDKEQALSIFRGAKGRMDDEYYALVDLGHVYRELNEPQMALNYYDQALGLARSHGRRDLEFTLLSLVADAYADAGDNDTALTYYRKSLAFAKDDRDDRMWALRRLGQFYVAHGEYEKALQCFNTVLPYLQAQHRPVLETWTLYGMGVAYHRQGKLQQAVESLNQALSIWPFNNHVRRELLREIGSVYQDSGDSQRAREFYAKALTESSAAKELQGEALALCGIARAERAMRQTAEAWRDVEAGLKILESVRLQIAGSESRSSYFAVAQENYEFYIDLLMQMHAEKPAQGLDGLAFEANERARARSLLDMLVEAHVDIHEGVDPKLLEQQRKLQQRLRARSQYQVQLLIGPHTPEQAEAIASELQELTSAYEETEARIRATSPRYAALTQPRTTKLKEVQEILDSDTLLLEYALGEERSYLWAVTDSNFASFILPKRAEIERAARRVYELLTARNRHPKGEREIQRERRIGRAREEYPRAAAQLSEMILGPVSSLLGRKRLLLVSDGALQYVPFAVLPVPGRGSLGHNGRLLMIESEIVSVPSASTVAVLRRELAGRHPAPRAVAVLADPVFDRQDPRVSSRQTISSVRHTDGVSAEYRGPPKDLERSWTEARSTERGWKIPRLPFSRREADAIIANARSSDAFEALDFRASRATATNPELAQYRVIHFATHGVLDSRTPALSGIILSLFDERGRPQNGFLRLWDIYNLHLPVDLVVLSGCQTALGKEIKGEGLVGLTRGFMYAGAARVMASLWAVDDAATAEFMSQFYQAMLRENLPPAAALRAAQVHLWSQKRWQRDPYFWAAFQLQGDWR